MNNITDNTIFRNIRKVIEVFDADNMGYVCISCLKRITEYMNAGHFISKKHQSCRFSLDNIHAQCSTCNASDGLGTIKYGNRIKADAGKVKHNYEKNLINKFTIWAEISVDKAKERVEKIKSNYNLKGKKPSHIERHAINEFCKWLSKQDPTNIDNMKKRMSSQTDMVEYYFNYLQ